MAEKNIVVIENGTVLLASGLSADAFGKIKTQKEFGTVAHITADGDVTFDNWLFDGTERRASAAGIEEVYYAGTFSGTTLLSALETGGETARTVAAVVCTALEKAVTDERETEPTGAGGIIVGEKAADGSQQVLFLPPAHFERAASNHGDRVYTEIQGAFLNKSLHGKAALAFTSAAIAYRALSGTNAYTAVDSTERSADMFDANVIPLPLLVTGLSDDVISAIHAVLQMKADLRILPGEKRTLAKQQAAIQNQRQDAMQRYTHIQIANVLTQAKVTAADAALTEKRTLWLKEQAVKIRRRRFFRRNRTSIITAVCITVGAVWFVLSFVKENKMLATSKGLTSRETVETLYTAIHRADVTVLKEVSDGLNNMMTIVSGFYVTNKQRLAMDQQNVTVTPGEWLFFANASNFWQFGLTQLTIDGTAADCTFNYPRRKDKPAPLTTENGAVLQKGDTVRYTVRYNLLHTDSSEQLFVERCSDVVTVTWKGNRWLVTDVESSSEQEPVKLKALRAAYAAAIEKAGDDIAAAIEELRAHYDWLPTTAELTSAAHDMAAEYNNSAAKAFLGQ